MERTPAVEPRSLYYEIRIKDGINRSIVIELSKDLSNWKSFENDTNNLFKILDQFLPEKTKAVICKLILRNWKYSKEPCSKCGEIHCKCVICPACDESIDDCQCERCEVCNALVDDCECSECVACGHLIAQDGPWCGECDVCADCCTCHEA